jgi:hypothetical protein
MFPRPDLDKTSPGDSAVGSYSVWETMEILGKMR